MFYSRFSGLLEIAQSVTDISYGGVFSKMPYALRTEDVDLVHFPQGRTKVQTEKIVNLPARTGFRIIKRVFDLVTAVILLIIMAVPMLIIAVIICVDSPGNPIYKQNRLGKNQVPFTIYKFRTMSPHAEENGPQWAKLNDTRTTRFGRILRNSHLDELPQLINIISGKMSFVGPRPERPEFYDVFDIYIDGFRQRTLVTPGLTGLAQVNGGYELLPEEKIIYDLEYIKNQSVWADLRCIAKTLHVVFKRKGAR